MATKYICPRCGGGTNDMEVHRNGSSRQCDQRYLRLLESRKHNSLISHGWRPVIAGSTAAMLGRMNFESVHPIIRSGPLESQMPFYFREWVVLIAVKNNWFPLAFRKKLLRLLRDNDDLWFEYHSQDFQAVMEAASRFGGPAASYHVVCDQEWFKNA